MKLAKIAFLLALSGFFVANSQTVKQTTKATSQDLGKMVNGLRMSISHDDAATGPEKAMRLIITFRNLSTDEVTFTPGTLVDCGGRSPAKTDLIKLNLTDSEGKPHRHLPYLGNGPRYSAFCAGSPIVPFVAILEPGASLPLPLDLGKYLDLSDSKEYEEARCHAGTYSVQAELTGPLFQSIVPMETWTATVTSDILHVHFDKEFAAPLDNYPR